VDVLEGRVGGIVGIARHWLGLPCRSDTIPGFTDRDLTPLVIHRHGSSFDIPRQNELLPEIKAAACAMRNQWLQQLRAHLPALYSQGKSNVSRGIDGLTRSRLRFEAMIARGVTPGT